MNIIEKRLSELQIQLPDAPSSLASYKPYVAHQGIVYISGHLPFYQGNLEYIGKLGRDFEIEEGQKAAELCILAMIAQLKIACKGDLSKVKQCLKIVGYINADEDFYNHPKVLNGASDLLEKIFGDKGRHTRCAVGVNSLPFEAAVQIEGMFAIEE
jgi:enamine deaminase RidA (YjgF/YER057c/UK114 family)